jgi:hypothetical protein
MSMFCWYLCVKFVSAGMNYYIERRVQLLLFRAVYKATNKHYISMQMYINMFYCCD